MVVRSIALPSLFQENRQFDPQSVLTLWQVSIIGESRLMEEGIAEYHVRLCDRLERIYGKEHPVIFYEASTNPFFGPEMWAAPMHQLRATKVRPCCTLVIPPIGFPDFVKVSLATGPSTWVSLPSVVSVS